MAPGSQGVLVNTTLSLNAANVKFVNINPLAGNGSAIFVDGAIGLTLKNVTLKNNTRDGLSEISELYSTSSTGLNVIKFYNTVVDSNMGAVNCGGLGNAYQKSDQFNIQRKDLGIMGGSCPGMRYSVLQMFSGVDTYDDPVGTGFTPVTHVIWFPSLGGPLPFLGDPTVCASTGASGVGGIDELRFPRGTSDCDIGAIEHGDGVIN